MRRVHLGRQANVERLISRLWLKHGHKDRHGYTDWMGENGFGDAICQLIDEINEGKLALPKEFKR